MKYISANKLVASIPALLGAEGYYVIYGHLCYTWYDYMGEDPA